MRVINQSRSTILCERCGIANNIFTRVRGLLGKSSLDDDEGLLIEPCPSIHMFGMKLPLDVLFITTDNIVTDLIENIQPGKYYVAKPHYGKAYSALELSVGSIERTSTQRGDRIVID